MLQEADFDYRQFTTPNAGDDRLYVKFYRDTLRDDAKSAAEGRPIFKEVDYIMIQAPGDLLKTVRRPVRPGDAERFPRQWQAYKSGVDQEVVAGTPLAQWPMISRAQVEELAYFKIRTVEQLAGVADNIVQKFMGLQQLKQSAKDWLARAENSKEIVELRNTNTAQSEEIAELKAAVRDLSARLNEQTRGKVTPR